MEQLNNEDLELSASKQRNESCLSSKTERLKPPHSYIALIATAILNSPGKKLTLTEINEYLVQHYAFFRGPYQGWKNSVRHNLSFNKCFVKILRDPARPWGKDNYWTVSSLHDYLLADGTFRRRRRRKPKRKDEREELSHSIITEQILPNNAVREFGVPDAARRSILMLPSYESVRGDRALSSSVHNSNKPATPKQFRGSFSIESILSEGKTRTKTTTIGARRRSEMAFPVRSVLNPNIGSLPGPRSIVHCCHPTPEPPLHFQRQEHLYAPMSPNAGFSNGCEVWNACHCFHSCAATTHFHACY